MKPVHVEPFRGFARSLPAALDAVGAGPALARQDLVVVKPNLVTASPPPVTFPAEAAATLVEYVRRHSRARVVIAEGCGDAGLTTPEVFEALGYTELARDLGVELVDLNTAPTVRGDRPGFRVFPEAWVPELLTRAFVISAAVLKRHSLAEVTLSLKNLMGAAPPERYGNPGGWKKGRFHAQMHRAVFEWASHLRPDLAVVDASVGLAAFHLGGPPCDPPVGKIVAGFDPVAVDAAGCRLLGLDWRRVEYLRLAHGVLGRATEADG